MFGWLIPEWKESPVTEHMDKCKLNYLSNEILRQQMNDAIGLCVFGGQGTCVYSISGQMSARLL